MATEEIQEEIFRNEATFDSQTQESHSVITFENKAQLTSDTGRTALSMLGGVFFYLRQLEDKCRIAKDGYVYYADGSKVKYFIRFGPRHDEYDWYIWEPKLALANIHKIESLRWKIISRLQEKMKEWAPLLEQIKAAGGKVFANCPHCPVEDNCYHVLNSDAMEAQRYLKGKTITEKYDTLHIQYHQTNQKPIHLEIGNAYYRYENSIKRLNTWKINADFLLEEVFFRFAFPDVGIFDPCNTLKIEINGRQYWFQRAEQDNRGKWSWKKLHFPEAEIKIISL